MGTEIERKFLVESESWRKHAGAGVRYRQGYLANTEHSSVRVRVSDHRAWLNIKEAKVGVARAEFEYEVPVSDAWTMLDTLCVHRPVEKVRFEVLHHGDLWEVDVFEGASAGLVVAEIELESSDQPFLRPEWVGSEVSHDKRYYNSFLAHHPYGQWRPLGG